MRTASSSKAMARREPEGNSDPNANETERNTDNTLQPSLEEGASPTPNDSVSALREERERLQSQLEYEREWAKLQKDRAELESLQHQRSRIQDGSLDALQAYQPNTMVTTVTTDRPKSYLPKPEPPHVFKARSRSDYNQWVRDCEKYHHRSPTDFQTEEEKVDFGAQYLGEVQRTTWEIWVGSKKHQNPTWADLKDQMLASMGTTEERQQQAFDRLKAAKQGKYTPIELLNYLRPLWTEVDEVNESRMINEFVAALNQDVRDILERGGPGIYKTLAEVELKANQAYRTLGKAKRKEKEDAKRSRKREASPGASGEESDGSRGGRKSWKRSGKRSRNQHRDGKGKSDGSKDAEKTPIRCYTCDQPGHLASNCPNKDKSGKDKPTKS